MLVCFYSDILVQMAKRYVQRFYAYIQREYADESNNRLCLLLTDNHSQAWKWAKEIFADLPPVLIDGHNYSQWAMGGYHDYEFARPAWYLTKFGKPS